MAQRTCPGRLPAAQGGLDAGGFGVEVAASGVFGAARIWLRFSFAADVGSVPQPQRVPGAPDPSCLYCGQPVMSRRVDGRGRHAHLVCQLAAERRDGRVSPRRGAGRARTMGG